MSIADMPSVWTRNPMLPVFRPGILQLLSAMPSRGMKSIHAIEAEFDKWISGEKKNPKTMKAVVYDQYGWHSPDQLEQPVTGTRKEILEQYQFYKECYPDKSLGLVCEEYYNSISHARRRINKNDKQ